MFECVQICTVSDTLYRHSSPAAVPIYQARPVWYRVQTGAACPASGRVCRVLHGLPLIWHGLRCCLCCAVCPGALEWAGAHRRGIQPPHSPARSVAQPPKKIKKTHPTFTNQNLSDCASLQKFRKIQKDPFRSLDCAIIS